MKRSPWAVDTFGDFGVEGERALKKETLPRNERPKRRPSTTRPTRLRRGREERTKKRLGPGTSAGGGDQGRVGPSSPVSLLATLSKGFVFFSGPLLSYVAKGEDGDVGLLAAPLLLSRAPHPQTGGPQPHF